MCVASAVYMLTTVPAFLPVDSGQHTVENKRGAPATIHPAAHQGSLLLVGSPSPPLPSLACQPAGITPPWWVTLRCQKHFRPLPIPAPKAHAVGPLSAPLKKKAAGGGRMAAPGLPLTPPLPSAAGWLLMGLLPLPIPTGASPLPTLHHSSLTGGGGYLNLTPLKKKKVLDFSANLRLPPSLWKGLFFLSTWPLYLDLNIHR